MTWDNPFDGLPTSISILTTLVMSYLPEKYPLHIEGNQALKPLNTKLKKAANSLCLTYFDYKLNLFGDLYSKEIGRCVDFIKSVTDQREWRQIVLPHT